MNGHRQRRAAAALLLCAAASVAAAEGQVGRAAGADAGAAVAVAVPGAGAGAGAGADAAASAATDAAGRGPGGELRLVGTGRSASPHGPLAAANRLQPGIAPPAGDSAQTEAELRHTLHWKVLGLPLALAANALVQATAAESEASRADARFNELHLSADLGAWQASAGRKVLGWDVGYGFRPNDVVQQETRRALFARTPEGRPVVMLEQFGAEHALALVWANPQRWNDAAERSRAAGESAWALRGYQRFGALDAHGFARHGRHTGASLGAALAWVATDELELHASGRRLERHDGWAIASGAGDALQATNPWRQALRGAATQWLVGANWTGLAQQSLMVEVWHDGTALADDEWDAWRRRNAALAASPAPATAAAGNLAWQATPFDAPNLRRDNLFVRLAWSPERWQWTFDTLFAPADRGRMHTAGLQWQGERWRLNVAWRVNGGPAESLFAQLPTRRSLLLAAVRAF
ncbi:MAG: hypothetical protein HZC37_22685 [Burkholderiales bacterium]|nr:hypothetical protein [Burkholderiales bacterium]